MDNQTLCGSDGTKVMKRMQTGMGKTGVAAALGILLCGTSQAWAQSTPTTQQMIDQLAAPKTRSLRNLIIESTPEAASTTAAPGTAGVTASPAAPAAEAGGIESPAARPSLSLLIQFDFDSAKVRPESREALANLSQALKSDELKASRFAVEGHTDAKGAADYNRRLSQLRADAVRDVLGQQGVDAGRLVTSGKGSSELARPDQPFAAENRRVRIVNLD